MSVSFFCPGAPERVVDEGCMICMQFDRPLGSCRDCGGTGVMRVPTSAVREVNVASGRAAMFFDLLGLGLIGNDSPQHGVIEPRDFGFVRSRVFKLLNGPDGARRSYTYEPSLSEEPGAARLYDGGISEEYLQGRLRDFLRLLSEAEIGGFTIHFG